MNALLGTVQLRQSGCDCGSVCDTCRSLSALPPPLPNRFQEEDERQRAAATFRAQPLPATLIAPAALPPPLQLPLTVPQPFALPGDALHERSLAELEGRRKRKAESEAPKAFHARSVPKTHGAPFQPQPSAAPLTDVLDPNLCSDARVTRRRAFDEQVAAKAAAAEAQRRREEEERAAREAEDVKRLRSQLQFKASSPPPASRSRSYENLPAPRAPPPPPLCALPPAAVVSASSLPRGELTECCTSPFFLVCLCRHARRRRRSFPRRRWCSPRGRAGR